MPGRRARSRRFSGRSNDLFGMARGFFGRAEPGSPAPVGVPILSAFGGCRMLRVFAATIVSSCVAFPALAASLDAAAVNNAEYSAKLSTDKIEPAVIRVQVLLDRARFSPGEIDGKL